ncbi:MAG TPA: orotate phosphoribosyltransferase [Steroidobacteraceae bacterium]|jgi:orotate phosphoribosyltransferase|nr:orotate phosphoribosyltransferase [Steroidobacteraceae bacterium]
MQQYQLLFVDLALRRNALRFGRFTLKSGRESPYFFNAGLFNDGESLGVLGRCYAAAIDASGLGFDMLFGPAYKGIALATATAVALCAAHGRNVAFAFNRKESKDHGEGGRIVGAPLSGRVLIVDDVLTAGTAVRESLDLIRQAQAQPAGVALILDRQERGQGQTSAVQELEQQGLKCVSIVTLDELIEALSRPADGRARISDEQLTSLRAYRQRYGAH